MVSVMTTTVTQQSMMLHWVNVGTDSVHSTVKVNVKMLTIVLPALGPLKLIIDILGQLKCLSQLIEN